MREAEKRAEIISAARLMLAGELDLIAGVRLIARSRHSFPGHANGVSVSFAAFEADMELYPDERVRKHYSPDFLARLDDERAAYIRAYGDEIREACRDVLRVFSADRG